MSIIIKFCLYEFFFLKNNMVHILFYKSNLGLPVISICESDKNELYLLYCSFVSLPQKNF